MVSQFIFSKSNPLLTCDLNLVSRLGELNYYPEEPGPAKKGGLMFDEFMLAKQWFTAMDSGVEQDFKFNEAVSLSVACKDQAEIGTFC